MTDLKKQDFYEAINGDWVKTAVIPSDKPATGGFQDLVEEIDTLLMSDFKEMASGTKEIPEGRMQDAVEFYRLAQDYESRQEQGAQQIQDLLTRIISLENFEDLNNQLPEWIKEGLPLPFHFYVDADMKNTSENALYLDPTSLILPDKTYYEGENEQAEAMLQVFFDMAVQVMKKMGHTRSEAETIAEQALAFDRALAPHVKSAEESADYSLMYNPRDIKDVLAYSDQFDFQKALDGIVSLPVEKVIVTEPAYFEAFHEFVSEDYLPLMKSWMYIQTILAYTKYLTEDLRQMGGTYSRYLSGIDEAASQEKAAYHLALNAFSQVVGLFYGKTYFGETAKEDVKHMVSTMVDVYKNRLSHNEWLTEETRDKAILKLNKIAVHVGYPDKIPAVYDSYLTKTAEQGGTLV